MCGEGPEGCGSGGAHAAAYGVGDEEDFLNF